MTSRTIAIGDIHGHPAALGGLLRLLELKPDDTLVTLGDYVDRGPDSRGVIELLIALADRCRLVPLLGNHEDMLFGARHSEVEERHWRYSGGDQTLACYGPMARLEDLPASHWEFLERCEMSHQTASHFFVHASYDPWLPLELQDRKTLLWLDLHDTVPKPHVSRKIAVVGHTVQFDGKILDLTHLKCIDTGCGHGGLLTALHVESGRILQVDEAGNQQ